VFSNFCLAQTIVPFAVANKYKSLRNYIAWKKFELLHSKTEKKKLVNKTLQFKFLSFGNEMDFFHIVDINFDSIPDLIYAGRYPIGLEQDNVMIWLNKKNKLELVFKVQGNIIQMEKDSINKSIRLQIIAKPCCADQFFVNTIYQLPAKQLSCFKINVMTDIDYYGEFNSKKFCTAKLEENMFMSETIFPKENLPIIKTVNSKKAFYVFPKPNYITSTEIKAEKDMDMIFTDSKNPAFALYAKGATVDILSEIVVKDRIYYFIKTQNTSKVLKTYIRNKKIAVYGWVRSTDIE
jgi:hypothetical protein